MAEARHLGGKLTRLRRPELSGLRPAAGSVEGALVRLDAGGAPQDWPPSLKKACLEALGAASWHHPQAAEETLRELIADRAGLPVASTALFSQGDVALAALLTAWCWQGRLAYATPTHLEYARVAQVLGITPIAVLSQADFSLPVAQLVGVARQHQVRLILVSNPSEPSGTLVTREEVLTIARATDAIVVVDERHLTFGEFTLADAVLEEENLVVVQGLGNAVAAGAWGVAWVLGAAEVIGEVEKVRGATPLPAAASLAAAWALQHQAALSPPTSELAARREALRGALAELEGVVTWPSVAHYMLVGTTMPGEALARCLRDQGIVVQAFDRSPLRTCIRVGLSTPAENDAFLSAMRTLFRRAPHP
ncbi:MAG: aminotransferase class I/II-fold pyridoxal phosphate-dependent enzyme [Candidatus Sericytochromatia bacterium]|nr:aminotransferase class I/II-fold pyridoxal phosphate-dependent enzyme [Candidatus Sericytochromatia bacterium]